LFKFLEDKQYALMKNKGELLSDINENSDLDILIKKSKIKETLVWLKSHSLVEHVSEIGTSYMTVVSMYFRDGTFLSIDLINKLKRCELEYLSVEEVLSNTVYSEEGVKLPDARYDFLYITLFYTLNHAVIPRSYVVYFDGLSLLIQRKVKIFLRERLDVCISSFDEFAQQTNSGIAHSAISDVIDFDKSNRGFNGIVNLLNYFIDTLKLYFRGDGVVMTFSGVDGAGKSTIIEKTKVLLETKFRKKVVVIRHRPSLLPILSAWVHGKKKAEERSMSTLPRQGTNKNVLSSLFRFTYYLVDFVIGQFVVWFKYTAKGHVVLYDRYYFDFIEDARRTNIQLPKWFCKMFYSIVFKHDVNFFLYAKPDIILQRKQELSAVDIVELTSRYRETFSSYSNNYDSEYVMINNENIKDTMDRVESLFVVVA
jgi:thymidylate kinase